MTFGKRPSGPLLLGGSIIGAVAALVAGYTLSIVLTKILLASVRPIVDLQIFLHLNGIAGSLAGINYLAAHHVALSGVGRGGTYLSVLAPVQLWTIIPIIAIIFGGWVAGGISRPEGKRDMLASALFSTAFYVALLLFFLPMFMINASVLNLMQFGGTQTDFPPVRLAASIWGTVLDAGIAGLMLFYVGNLWEKTRPGWGDVKRFFSGRGFLPSWAAGAVSAIVIAQVVLCVLVAVGGFVAAKRAGLPNVAVLLAAPSVAGMAWYLLHGVTVSVAFGARLSTISLLTGTRQMMKLPGQPLMVMSSRHMSHMLWLGLLIPVAALTIGAYVAYKNRDRGENPVVFSLKMAGAYTILMLILSSFYSLHMAWAASIPGFEGINRLTSQVTFGTVEMVVSGLVMGFICSLIGSLLARGRKSSEGRA